MHCNRVVSTTARPDTPARADTFCTRYVATYIFKYAVLAGSYIAGHQGHTCCLHGAGWLHKICLPKSNHLWPTSGTRCITCAQKLGIHQARTDLRVSSELRHVTRKVSDETSPALLQIHKKMTGSPLHTIASHLLCLHCAFPRI